MENYAIGMIGGLVLIVLLIGFIKSLKPSPPMEFGPSSNVVPLTKYQCNQNKVEQAVASSEEEDLAVIKAVELHTERLGTRVMNPVTGRLKNYNEKHPLWKEGLNTSD